MRKRDCQILHHPPYSYGDCIRACLATLTDDDKVPHVFDERPAEKSWAMLRKYFSAKNIRLVVFSAESLEELTENNPDILYVLIGKQKFGGMHAVVGMNGKIVHDPALIKKELEKIPDINVWGVVVVA